MDDVSIQYTGFSPSDFAKTYVREIIEQIHEESPSSATVRVTISKVGENAFKGVLQIRSHAGPFFATATGSRLTEIPHRLLDRVRRQLDKWKSRRFTLETLRRSAASMH